MILYWEDKSYIFEGTNLYSSIGYLYHTREFGNLLNPISRLGWKTNLSLRRKKLIAYGYSNKKTPFFITRLMKWN